MATIPKWKRPQNPLKTRSGKTRLGPLGLSQLQELAEKSTKPKEKQKILNRIAQLQKAN